jgi:arsenate reductase-like glutaredoxin family protein
MYLLIGKENCSRCESIKLELENKKISYKYKLLNELPEEDKTKYLKLAREKKIIELPLIIKDNVLLSIQEVRNAI